MAPASAKVIDFIDPTKAKEVGGELATTTQSLAQRLAATAVTDLVSLEQAVTDRQAIGEAVKRVQEFFAPFKQMAHRLHKALCDRENEILGPLLKLDGTKRTAISDFKAAQDRLRQQRERELGEQQRRDDEARAAAEAAQLESAGEHEMAAAVMEEAIAAPAAVVVLADETKQVEGLHFTRRYLWRFAGGPKEIDQTPPAVLERVMQLLPRDYLAPDTKKIGAFARAMKGSAKVPGLEFYHVDDPTR